MRPENSPRILFWYDQSEAYESRCQGRLQTDLGIDEIAVETILCLRNQVVELQAQIRRPEAELSAQDASLHLRIAPYKEVVYKATWIELEAED